MQQPLRLRRFLALLVLALACALGMPQVALADDELPFGQLILTEDIWSVGVIVDSGEPTAPAPLDTTESTSAAQQGVASGDAAVDVDESGDGTESDATHAGTIVERAAKDGTVETSEGVETTSENTTTTSGDAQQLASDDSIAADAKTAVTGNASGTHSEDTTPSVDVPAIPSSTATPSTTEATPAEATPSIGSAADSSYMLDSIVAVVAPGITFEQLNSLIDQAADLGVRLAATGVTQLDLDFGTIRLSICDGTLPDDAIAALAQVDGIISAQRNHIYAPVGTVTRTVISSDAEDLAADQSYRDLLATLGYDLGSAAFTSVNDKLTRDNWVADAVDAWGAWDLAKVQGSLAVAVVDTGIDLNHDDLHERIVASYNSYDSKLSANDENGHGTHVAGIIAGTANNAFGLTGLSYNANLIAIKASAPNVNTFETASIVRAYAWLLSEYAPGETVAEHYNVRVVNLSVGGVDDTDSANDYDDEIISAMLRARRAGILTVVAAGNKTASAEPYLNYPGDSDVCISVMNLMRKTDGSYDLSPTSNYNLPGTTYKDVCAPGTTIYSSYYGRDEDGKSKFVIMDGTSMAAPQVAGIAALMFATNPQLTPELAMTLLEVSCTDLGDEGWDERFGFGLVNAAAAVRLASGLVLAGPDAVAVGGVGHYQVSGTSNSADADGWTWSVVAADASTGASAQAEAAGSGADSSNGVVTGLAEGSVIVRAVCTAINRAEVAVTRVVRVISAVVEGLAEVVCGQDATFSVADAAGVDDNLKGLEWSWIIDEGAALAHVDAAGTLRSWGTGTVTVRAICRSNPWLSYTKQVTIVPAAA